MKSSGFKIKPTVVFAVLSILLLSGCTSQDEIDCGNSGKTSQITLLLNVPSETATTRSLTSSQQSYLNTVDMLVFKEDGSDEKFTYHSSVDMSAFSQNGSLWKGRVSVPLSEQSEKYRFVMLANLSSELRGVLSSFTTSMTKAQVLQTITFAVAGAWDTTTPRFLPMWGETENTYIISNSTNSIGTIPLVRSVASVEMLFNPSGNSTTGYTASGFDHFLLEDVKVFNVSNSGYAAPDGANISANVVTVPTVPSAASAIDVSYAGISSKYGTTGDIYITESSNTASGANIDEGDQTFLVISGYYGASNTTKKTYYRLDFVSNSTTFLRYDILRNHRYTFLVTSVDGEGYDTEEEAAGSTPVNMEAEVLEWNEGTMSNVNFDGQYYLTTTPGELTLSREARATNDTDNKVSVITDHPDGWEIGDIEYTSTSTTGWLFATSTDLNTLCLLPIKNSGSSSRTAYVNITAGNLTSRVKVTQTTESGYSLSITDLDGTEINELLFSSYAGLTQADVEAQGFKVNWYPKTAPLSVKVELESGASMLFPFDTATSGYSSITNGNVVTTETTVTKTGLKTYSLIRPVPMTTDEVDEETGNPFLEKGSRVTYTLTDSETGTVVTKIIYIRQTNYCLLLSGKEDLYMIDGNSHTITVRCNTEWEMTVDSGASPNDGGTSSDIAYLVSSGFATGITGGFNTIGEAITFTTTKRATNGRIIVKYSDIDTPAKFEPVVDTLYFSNWAGSNIYYNGTNMTFANYDDYSMGDYQGLYFKWGSLWGISPVGTFNSTTTVLYPPTGGSQTGGYAYTSIPAATTTDSSLVASTLESAFSADYTDSWDVNSADGKGDICWALTKQGMAPGASQGLRWRMATLLELVGTFVESQSFGGTSASSSSSADGTESLGIGYYTGYYPVAFPLGGQRNYNTGALSGYGTTGYYWSNTLQNDSSWNLEISSAGVARGRAEASAYGRPVRCILMVD